MERLSQVTQPTYLYADTSPDKRFGETDESPLWFSMSLSTSFQENTPHGSNERMSCLQRRCSGPRCLAFPPTPLSPLTVWESLSKYVLGEQSMKASSSRCKTKRQIRKLNVYLLFPCLPCLLTRLLSVLWWHLCLAVFLKEDGFCIRAEIMWANVFSSGSFTAQILFFDVYKASQTSFFFLCHPSTANPANNNDFHR